MEPKELALLIAKSALDKQALSVEIINIEGKASYADFLVICSGRTVRQVEAIIDGVESDVKKEKVYPLGVEGRQNGEWVLMDYGDVIFHVFEDNKRGFYDLEGLWIDALRVPPPDSSDKKS
ncbi:MAG: ribosome silencing factor [Deltaproteobacteria bacterium]|nr:ribosome silencing factor [Deltaproteobacteria bacterium]